LRAIARRRRRGVVRGRRVRRKSKCMRICLMSAIRSEMLGRKKIPEFYSFLLVRMLEISK
jgi:hypothetical protein